MQETGMDGPYFKSSVPTCPQAYLICQTGPKLNWTRSTLASPARYLSQKYRDVQQSLLLKQSSFVCPRPFCLFEAILTGLREGGLESPGIPP